MFQGAFQIKRIFAPREYAWIGALSLTLIVTINLLFSLFGRVEWRAVRMMRLGTASNVVDGTLVPVEKMQDLITRMNSKPVKAELLASVGISGAHADFAFYQRNFALTAQGESYFNVEARGLDDREIIDRIFGQVEEYLARRHMDFQDISRKHFEKRLEMFESHQRQGRESLNILLPQLKRLHDSTTMAPVVVSGNISDQQRRMEARDFDILDLLRILDNSNYLKTRFVGNIVDDDYLGGPNRVYVWVFSVVLSVFLSVAIVLTARIFRE